MGGTALDAPPREGGRRRLPRAVREQQLLDVAEDLFTTRGYERVSIEDVARAAGVSRPIVYEHHGSKEGLLLACVRRVRTDFEQALADLLTTADTRDPAELITRSSELFFSLLERHPRRWSLLFSTTTALSGQLSEKLRELHVATIARIVELSRPFVPHLPDEPLYAYAYAVAGVGEQLGRWWLSNPDLPRERVQRYHRNFIVACISTLTCGDDVGGADAMPGAATAPDVAPAASATSATSAASAAGAATAPDTDVVAGAAGRATRADRDVAQPSGRAGTPRA